MRPTMTALPSDSLEFRREVPSSLLLTVLDATLECELVARNVYVRSELAGVGYGQPESHRTSVRLAPYMWDALNEIARRERMTVDDICSHIARRIGWRSMNPSSGQQVSLANAIRVFSVVYFRHAAEEAERLAAAYRVATESN